jgi:RNA polymerase sigma-70 factor (ECF subfamily)
MVFRDARFAGRAGRPGRFAAEGDGSDVTRMAEAQAGADAQDVARAANGDAAAMSRLYRRHASRVQAVAFRLTRDAALSEDVVQETFIKLWRHAGRWDAEKASVPVWLSRIAANAAIDAMRRRKRLAFTDEPPDAPDPADGPDDQHHENEMQRAVQSAMAALPERQRVALTLSVYSGLTAAQVGEAVGLGERGAESLLGRARANLKKLLAERGRELLET